MPTVTTEQQMRTAIDLHQSGQLGAAVEQYRQVLGIEPHNPDALNLMGLAIHQQGQSVAALSWIRQALKAQPENAYFWFNLGSVSKAAGELEQAVSAYRECVSRDPANSAAWTNLGNILAEFKRHREALECFDRASTLDSGDPLPRNGSGLCHKALGDHREAERALLEAVRLNPGFVSAWVNLARLYFETDRYEESENLLQQILAQSPNQVEALLCHAELARNLGELETARRLFERVLEVDPLNAKAFYGLSGLGRLDANGRVVATILRHWQERSDKQLGDAHIPFGLAKVFDEAGSVDQAFKLLEEGNRIVDTANSDIEENHSSWVTAMIETCSSPLPAIAPSADTQLPIPLFILGMPRSGTTLVEQALSCHDAVFGGGELAKLVELISIIDNTESGDCYPTALRHASEAQLREIADHYRRYLRTLDGDARVVSNKSPYSFLHIGLIFTIFPDAKVVHCHRDPVDTCLSCYMQLFGAETPFAYDLEKIGRYYAEYRRLMNHWEAIYPNRIHTVEYEGLVERPDATIRALLEYCDLAWDPVCLSPANAKRAVKTLSVAQVRQPIYQSAVGRWRRYERHLSPLLRVLESAGIPIQ